MNNEEDAISQEFEALAAQDTEAKYILKLYVAGLSPKSKRAIHNIKEICETHLKERYELQVIDLYQNPTLAKGEQIIAVPTLVKKLPHPLRKIIGDMSDEEKLLIGLDLQPQAD
ncbi:MAG: circadian clock protein KaiB [Anaerolineae bacterium]|nr:circadian clock protein KaiB [Anaerolineae bacterium]